MNPARQTPYHDPREDRSPAPQGTNKSLSDVFNSFVRDATQRFPNLDGRLLVLDMNEGKVYSDPRSGISAQAAKNYMANTEYYRMIRRNPQASSASEYDPRSQVANIYINDRIDSHEINNISKETEQRLYYVLDHELAHQTIPNGSNGPSENNSYATLIGESVADAYALIRHYQRFGTEGEQHDQYVDPAQRALYMIRGGDLGHFTSFVLDEIEKQKDKIDFNALNPAETAELARRFALKYMPATPVVTDLYKTFTPLRQARSETEAVKALISITLSPKTDYFSFKLGNIWLKDILTDKATIQRLGMTQQLVTDVTQKLKEKEAQSVQEDVLFNLPGAKTPAQQVPANQNRVCAKKLTV